MMAKSPGWVTWTFTLPAYAKTGGLRVLRSSLMHGRLSSSVRRWGAGKGHMVSYLMDNPAALHFGLVWAPQSAVKLN